MRILLGNIFIGGVDGMISFKAEAINYIPQSYDIYPFRLLVNGEVVQVNDKSQILNKYVSITCFINGTFIRC